MRLILQAKALLALCALCLGLCLVVPAQAVPRKREPAACTILRQKIYRTQVALRVNARHVTGARPSSAKLRRAFRGIGSNSERLAKLGERLRGGGCRMPKLSVAAHVAVSGDSPLKNAGFESAKSWVNLTGRGRSRSLDQAHSGTAALKIVSGASARAVHQKIGTWKSPSFEAAVWIRQSGTVAVLPSLWWFSSNVPATGLAPDVVARIDILTPGEQGSDGEWLRYGGTFSTPAGAFARFVLLVPGSQEIESIYFDDAEVILDESAPGPTGVGTPTALPTMFPLPGASPTPVPVATAIPTGTGTPVTKPSPGTTSTPAVSPTVATTPTVIPTATPTATATSLPAAAGAPIVISHRFFTLRDAAKWIDLPAASRDGAPLSYTITTPPSHGVLSGSNGQMKYVPAAGYVGTDSFDFRVTSGETSGSASIFIVVQEPQAYTPPIGIPAPAFGITQTVGNVFGSDEFFTHFVKNGAGCNDNGPGNISTPLCSIPDNVPAGSVVVIAPGTYQKTLDIRSSGTASQPVFYRGQNPNNPPIITSKLSTNGAAYLILENLIVDRGYNSSAVNIYNGSHHVALRHSVVRNGQGAVLIYDNSHHVIIFNNKLGENGANADPSGDVDDNGVQIGEGSENWILDNLVHDAAGSGIVLNAGFGEPNSIIQKSYVGRNEVTRMRQSGIWSKQSMDSVFSQNLVFSLRLVSHTSADGIGYQYGPERLWIIFNRVFDAEYGIRSGSNSVDDPGRDTYIIGNVLHDIHDKRGQWDVNNTWRNGGITLPGGVDKYVYNNLVYNSDSGINCSGDGLYRVANNIVADVTRTGADHLWVPDEAGTTNWSASDNLFWQSAGSVRTKIRSSVYSLPQFQATFPSLAAGNIGADPKFQNAGVGDFHLLAGSPAIDTGAALDFSSEFYATFGVHLNLDFDGQLRPLDGNGDGVASWDIGPTEKN